MNATAYTLLLCISMLEGPRTCRDMGAMESFRACMMSMAGQAAFAPTTKMDDDRLMTEMGFVCVPKRVKKT